MVALYMGLMQYYAWGWILTPLFEPKQDGQTFTKVTVIVPARNEEANIERVVQCLMAQNYRKDLLEIIVVDDHSEDSTAEVVQRIANPQLGTIGLQIRLGIYMLPNNLSGKKAAITYGIAQATGDLIITTDADCEMGANWVNTVAQYYDANHYKVLTGPVAFSQVHGPSSLVLRLLQQFQSLDLMGLMFITAGSLRFKFPHMANGANFAFEKKLFQSIGGYSGIDNTPTGDDILFLLKAHSHRPGCAGFVKAKEAIVTTPATATWAAFWQQRVRWVSKAAGFGDARLTAVLTFYYVYALAILVFGVWMCFKPFMLIPFIVLLLGKLLPELIMLVHATSFFGRSKELLWFLPSQLLHTYYVLRIGIQSQFKKYDWKGRKY